MKQNIWKLIDSVFVDQEIEAIVINSPTEILVEKNGKFQNTDFILLDKDIDSFVREVSIHLHMDNDKWHPLKEGVIAKGIKINIVSPPISKNHLITLKKPARNLTHKFSAEQFSLAPETFNFLLELIKNRKNVIISGGYGCGKTTLLHYFLQHVPTNERVIILDEQEELFFERGNFATIHPDGLSLTDRNTSFSKILHHIAGMKPDRIVIGHILGKELFDFVEILGSGLLGSFSAIHSNSVLDGIKRMETLYMLGAELNSPEIARRQIFTNVNYIIHLNQAANGTRYIADIYELSCDHKHNTKATQKATFDGHLCRMI